MEPKSTFGDQLTQIVLKRIAEDRLVLPSLPAAVLKCLKLIQNPEVDLKQIASALERDPIVTARLIRISNSAAYGGAGALKSVEMAVTRLGIQKLKTLFIELSANQVFESQNAAIAQAFRGLWEHSLAVGTVARDVAALCGKTDPDLAYLAGLLHDIGKPALACLLLEAERTLGRKSTAWMAPSEWLAAVQKNHRKVAVALAEKWNLPEPVRECIADCSEYNSNDRFCAANVVRFANAIVKQQGIYVGPMDVEDVNALIMIGRSLLNLGNDIADRITNNLKQRVQIPVD